MDVNLYGLSFSKFIQQFKETYKVNDNTYDYMSLLKIIDYPSYGLLSSIYARPNDILNEQLTPLVNSMSVTSLGQQTGGMNTTAYLIILIMFIQTVSTVLAGPAQIQATETLLTDDPQKWREIMSKPLGDAPKSETYRSKGFFYGFYELTEPQKAKFQADLNTWQNNVNKQKIAAAAIGEKNEEERQKSMQQMGDITTKLKTELSESTAEENISKVTYKLTEIEEMNQMILSKALQENSELRKLSEERGLALSFLKGMIVAGKIGFAITYRRQFTRMFRGNRAPYYQGQEIELYNQDQYPREITYNNDDMSTYNRGGKYRKTRRNKNKQYKKKQTKRRH